MLSQDLKIHQNINNHTNQMPKLKVDMNRIGECHTPLKQNKVLDGDQKIFKCRECTKMTSNVHALMEHVRTIHNYKEHQCHLCGNDYKTSGRLKVG